MKLVILSQPGTAADGIDFYKDEGGKGNWMRVVVSLRSAKAKDAQKLKACTLRTKLFFESGLPVEENDQKILVVRHGGSPSSSSSSSSSPSAAAAAAAAAAAEASSPDQLGLGPSRKKCTIEFRIQKVSRRKDNQRFKVQISIAEGAGAASVAPVFTRPITVLSKRKIPARLRNDPEAIARYKANKAKRTSSSKQAAGGSASAGSKRARAEDATPEMRPLTALHSTAGSTTKKNASSNKRQRLLVSTGDDAALRGKIEQMARTVDNLYTMMVDQRVQISRLQEQVRVLTDNQEPMFSDMVPSAPVPTTGFDLLSSRPVSPIQHGNSRSSYHIGSHRHQHQLFNEDAATGRPLPGSPSLRPRKMNSRLRKERSVKDVISESDMMQWSFDAAAMPALPELNL
jgi:uncharacterized coiled-coil protein SlyX